MEALLFHVSMQLYKAEGSQESKRQQLVPSRFSKPQLCEYIALQSVSVYHTCCCCKSALWPDKAWLTEASKKKLILDQSDYDPGRCFFKQYKHTALSQKKEKKKLNSCSGWSYVLPKEQGLQEETCCTQNAHQDKDPQEYPVNHHGNILPVILDL